MDKVIIIQFDFHDNSKNLLSYEETVNNIYNGAQLIFTTCLDFFDFYYLDKGYDVKVIRKNGEYILLSELLLNDNTYTDREIRKAHNVRKLLLSNSLSFRKGNAMDSLTALRALLDGKILTSCYDRYYMYSEDDNAIMYSDDRKYWKISNFTINNFLSFDSWELANFE